MSLETGSSEKGPTHDDERNKHNEMVRRILEDRIRVVLALAMIDVTLEQQISPSGNINDTKYMREHWQTSRQRWTSIRNVFQEVLEGHSPSLVDLSKPGLFVPSAYELGDDLYQILRLGPWLLNDLEFPKSQLAQMSTDDLYIFLKQQHLVDVKRIDQEETIREERGRKKKGRS